MRHGFRYVVPFPGLSNASHRAGANGGSKLAVRFAIAALLAGGLADRAHAITITPTFDSSFNSAANTAAAESAVQTAISTIDSLYLGTGNIPVLFKYDASLGGGGESNSTVFNYSYNSWLTKLQSISATHSSNTTLSMAVASLPAAGTVSQTMSLTGVYANQIMGASLFLGFDSSGNFNGSGGQTYAAVITMSAPSTVGSYYSSTTGKNSEAVSTAEHEINEVFGGGGAGSTLTSSSTGTPSSYGDLDLYRYLAGSNPNGTGTLGARSYSSSSSVVAYFSINGGTSAVTDQLGNPVGFNQDGTGDYADFTSVTGIGHIQDAFSGAYPSPVYTSASPEATMMEAIGYNLAVPEPASTTLLAVSLAGLASSRRRRVGHPAPQA